MSMVLLEDMMKNKIKENSSCPLPAIRRNFLFDIINYCNNKAEPSSFDSVIVAEFVKDFDPLTLFHLIQVFDFLLTYLEFCNLILHCVLFIYAHVFL